MSLLEPFLRAVVANAVLAILAAVLGPLASAPAFLLFVVLAVTAPAFLLLVMLAVSVPFEALGTGRERPAVRLGAYAAVLAICLWGIHGVSPWIAQALGAGTLGFLSCVALLLVVEAARETVFARAR